MPKRRQAHAVTKDGYKHDSPKKQTGSQRDARRRILNALTSGGLAAWYGVGVAADDPELVEDPTGDSLDALLCAAQAAWAWRNCARLFGNRRIDPWKGGSPIRRRSERRLVSGGNRRSR